MRGGLKKQAVAVIGSLFITGASLASVAIPGADVAAPVNGVGPVSTSRTDTGDLQSPLSIEGISATKAIGAAIVAGKTSKIKFVPIGNADLGGTFTTVRRGQGARGITGSAMVLPAFKVGEKGYILPIYAFNGGVSDHMIDETVLFQTRQTHSVSLGYRYRVASKLDIKGSVDGAFAFNKETRDEKFGKGLYDYRDFGGRLGLAWGMDREGREEQVNGTIRAYLRKYPNYKSLASENRKTIASISPEVAKSIGDKEVNPKDFLGAEAMTDAVLWLSPEMRSRFSYAFGMRFYEDRYLRNTQGWYSGTKRTDMLHSMGAKLDWAALPKWVFRTGVDSLFFGSNGSAYDWNQPKTAYIPHYYQFLNGVWTVGATWETPLGSELHPSISGGLGLGLQGYTDRRAQDSAGKNLSRRQRDFTYSANLGAEWPFTKWLSATLGVNGEATRSNNRFEKYVKYSYEILGVYLGIRATY